VQEPSSQPPLYRPLDASRDETRLLNLHPGSRDEALQASLSTISMHDISRPTYEALSYVWDQPGRSETILLEGRLTHVQATVEAALRGLRSRHSVRRLWIDSICINQADNIEKGHQAELMIQVYGLASQLVVWLGEADERTAEAVATVTRIADREMTDSASTSSNEVINPTLTEHGLSNDVDLEPLANLLQRPWFSRRWIRQEVSSASRVVFRCGGYEIAQKDLRKTSAWLARQGHHLPVAFRAHLPPVGKELGGFASDSENVTPASMVGLEPSGGLKAGYKHVQEQGSQHSDLDEAEPEEPSKKFLRIVEASKRLHDGSSPETRRSAPVAGNTQRPGEPSATTVTRWSAPSFAQREPYTASTLAADREFEDTVQTIESVLLEKEFNDELSAIEQWFRVLTEQEQIASLFALLQQPTTLSALELYSMSLTKRLQQEPFSEDDTVLESAWAGVRTSMTDADFKNELEAIGQWHRLLSDSERWAAMYTLLQQLPHGQAQIAILLLRRMIKGDIQKLTENLNINVVRPDTPRPT